MRPTPTIAGLALAGMALLSLAMAQSQSVPDGLPPCSGMAGWGPECYLVSHDLKNGQAGARFGLVHTLDRFTYTPLECDWSGAGGDANDLESLTPVEGMPGHYLSAESGYFRGNYGRLFWLQAEDQPQPRLKVVRQFALPTLPQEIEGLSTLRLDSHRWLVVLGGRGGKAEEPGRLYWGVIDSSDGSVTWPTAGLQGSEIHLPRRLGPYARTLSDMFVDQAHHLWISSCASPGRVGPNRSLIFQAGSLSEDLKQPFHRNVEAQPVWWIDGCKIEGLAACTRPGYGPAYVTDDDNLGGLWRAVPANPSLSY